MKLLRRLTVNHGALLIPHIEAYQTAGKFPPTWNIQIENFKEKDDHFHPSSHCFLPPIDLWRQRKGLASYPPITSALRRTFDVGHMWHGYLEEILIDMGFVLRENVERAVTVKLQGAYGPFTAKGTIDLLNVEIPGHGTWLVDIKTMNGNEFSTGPMAQTSRKWEAQVNCYIDWAGKTNQAMILAVCKDSPHDMKEFKITPNTALLNEIYDRWSFVEYAIQTNKPPEFLESYTYEVDPLLLNPGDSVMDAELAKPKYDSVEEKYRIEDPNDLRG